MTKIGIIGCGNIAPAYIIGCANFADDIHLVVCADIDQQRAESFANRHGLRSQTVNELLSNDEVDIVINLTIPAAHTEISLRTIEARKHVYSEKPLALNRHDGKRILQAAQAKGVRVGCAPDTFLGSAGQRCRHAVDHGDIGRPISAVAFMMCHGHENWHPNPAFYYQQGGGPLLDMGPYYLTSLINLLGPVQSVSGFSERAFPERIAQHEDICGQVIPVEIDTHVAALLRFSSGVIVNLVMSFDVWQHNLPHIEVYGTNGTLSVPDPNNFDGNVRVWKPSISKWEDLELVASTGLERGTGVADMARSIQTNRPHCASGQLAYHVLDTMLAINEASENGQVLAIESELPGAVPVFSYKTISS